jgi:adenosylcobinamide kinase/adenosylcobinamide-phosphate guanylyltransferase
LKETILVIGGCKSGKSRHALEMAEEIPAEKRIFIATCVPQDEEMKRRVLRHQAERSRSWQTREVPIRLAEVIREQSTPTHVILVDCLTLWVTNLLMENNDADTVAEAVHNLTLSLQKAVCPVILVSNEVGTGIVPENSLARQFRDAAGLANQQIAACATKVVWMVAGIPVAIKNESK